MANPITQLLKQRKDDLPITFYDDYPPVMTYCDACNHGNLSKSELDALAEQGLVAFCNRHGREYLDD